MNAALPFLSQNNMRESSKSVQLVYAVALLLTGLFHLLPVSAVAQSPFKQLIAPEAEAPKLTAAEIKAASREKLKTRGAELEELIKRLEELEPLAPQDSEQLNLLKLTLSVVVRLNSAYEELEVASAGSQTSELSVEALIKNVDSKGKIDTYYKYHRLEEQLLALFGEINSHQSTHASVKKLADSQRISLENHERAMRLVAERGGKDNWEYQQLELQREILKYKRELLDVQLQLAEDSARQASERKVILEGKLNEFKSDLSFPLESLKKIEADLDAEVGDLQQQLKTLEKKDALLDRLKSSSGIEASDSIMIVADRFLRRHRDCLLAHIAFKEKERILWAKRYELHGGELTEEFLHSARIKLVDMASGMTAEIATFNDYIVNGVKMLMTAESANRQVNSKGRKLIEQVGEIGREALSAMTLYVGALNELLHLISILDSETRQSLSSTGLGYYLWSNVSHAFSVFWNYEIFALSESPITPFKLIISVALFLGGIYLSRLLSTKFAEKVLLRLNIESGVAHAIQSISYYLLVALFAVGALHVMHIPLTVFTLAGGALAIGVGFGSQNIVNNFFSGLILLFEQPIRVGDIIKFEQQRGTVRRIGARSTIIVTPENHELVVPNSLLVEQNVLNYTLGDNKVRRSIFVGVAYGSETRLVNELLIKATAQHGSVLKSPKPEVLFREFGDSALNFELRFWVAIRGYAEALRIESAIRHRINNLFNSAGVVIAFPQRDVHLNVTGTDVLKLIDSGSEGAAEVDGAAEGSAKKSNS